MIDIGVLGAGRLGGVDPSGGVHPSGRAWALRWWIGADDRWHAPSAEPAVRQSLVGGTPVVETRLRVPGGDVVAHAYGVSGPGGASALVVELTNETPVPVAAGLVVDGAGFRVEGPTLHVDGGAQVRLPREPSEVAGPVAFLPITHKTTLRVVVTDGVEAPDPAELPDADRVAAGWRRQVDVDTRWVLPDPTIGATVDACRGALLLAEPVDLLDGALVAEARRTAGLPGVDGARVAFADRQRLSGAFDDGTGSPAATGQALVLLGPEPDEDLVGPVAKAARRIDKERQVRRWRKDPTRAGLLPGGTAPAPVGGEGPVYWDDWWSLAGLARAVRLLAASGQPEAAAAVAAQAESFAADVARAVAAVAADGVIPAGPGRAVDGSAAGVVVAAVGGLDPTDPAVVATLDHLRDHEDLGGWAPWVLGLLAASEVAAGDERGLSRLGELAAAARGLAAWPRPDGPAQDPRATAAFVLAVRHLLVTERGPVAGPVTGLAVLPVVPPSWYGQGIELHDQPTACGRFGFAVRWHGERPALLWDLDPDDPDRPFLLTAPGLDPAWSSTEHRGEALLAPPPDADEVAAAEPVPPAPGAPPPAPPAAGPVDDLGSFS